MIMITGGSGFLGSRLSNYLASSYDVLVPLRSNYRKQHIQNLAKNVKVVLLENDSLERIFENYEIDVVINCVANYGKNEELGQIIEANLLYPVKLLDLSVRHGVKRFIHTGSSLPIDTSAYALSKQQILPWLAKFKDRIKIDHIISEYFYGPGDDEWKFVTMIIKKLIQYVPNIDFSSGMQKRDFIFIDDLCEAYQTILMNTDAKISDIDNWNVGSGVVIPLKELVENCASIIGNETTKLNFGVLQDRPNEFSQEYTDQDKLRKLGWRAKTSLDEGILKILNELNLKK